MSKLLSYSALAIRSLVLFLLEGYRTVVSPLLPSSCRFYPTCSTYAGNAIRIHGWRRGAVLAAKRVLRCHPFHPGGFDPVPTPTAERGAAGEEA